MGGTGAANSADPWTLSPGLPLVPHSRSGTGAPGASELSGAKEAIPNQLLEWEGSQLTKAPFTAPHSLDLV